MEIPSGTRMLDFRVEATVSPLFSITSHPSIEYILLLIKVQYLYVQNGTNESFLKLRIVFWEIYYHWKFVKQILELFCMQKYDRFFFLIQIENHLLNKNNLFHVSRLFYFFFLQLKTCYFYHFSSWLLQFFYRHQILLI